MSFQDAIGRLLVMKNVGGALTGRFEDLRKLSGRSAGSFRSATMAICTAPA